MKRFAGGILVKGNKILLGLRHPQREHYPNCWDFIGGNCLAGELYSSAMIRELKEELNIIVNVFKDFMTIDRSPEFFMKLFLVTEWQGIAINNAPEEHTRIEWFTPLEAKSLKFLSSEYIIAMDILAKKITL